MTTDEIEAVAKAAAKEAVAEWLLTLGVDASDHRAIIDIQKDFATLRAVRESVDLIRRKSIATAITTLVAGLLGLVWYALKGH